MVHNNIFPSATRSLLGILIHSIKRFRNCDNCLNTSFFQDERNIQLLLSHVQSDSSHFSHNYPATIVIYITVISSFYH
jgi:hypothetical protein